MQATAIVNYHITSDKTQAYHIDANGEKGNLLSPVLAPTEVKVEDLRNKKVSVSFWSDSLSFTQSVSEVSDFEAPPGDWEETYNRELSNLLAQQIEAKEVIVFDHTVRVDDPNSERKPARNVHSDYSPSGAHERLKDIIGEDSFGFVNVWRPVRDVIMNAPLGFVLPGSVNADDWLLLQLIYPDRIGEIMGLVNNTAHEWVYLSNMSPNEVAFFNIYDNKGLPSIGHSALDFIEGNTTGNSVPLIRRSIESRTLVRY